MIVLGLTGSIAVGKSEAANVFREHGIPVFDADAEVHHLYGSPEGVALLMDIVPGAIQNNAIDRAALSAIISKDPTLLSKIEQPVHAAIRRKREAFLAACREAGSTLVVLDVPLLFETNSDKDVDLILVLTCEPQTQRKRALERPGMTEDRLNILLSRQMHESEKRKRADIVIENDGSKLDLRNKLETLIKTLVSESNCNA
jgi:dephospho-CoA kinase